MQVLVCSCMGLSLIAVSNVRHLYTEWEENPGKMILRSKSSVILLPFAPSLVASQDERATGTSFPPDSEAEGTTESAAHGAGGSVERGGARERVTQRGVESAFTLTDSGFISVPESSVSGGSGLDDDDTSSHDDSHYFKHPFMATTQGITVDRNRYSPQQLKTIQARVKDSLKNQGVFLYDPVTGAGETRGDCVLDNA